MSVAQTPADTLTAGTWAADTAHSSIGFQVRHMAVGKVKGSFTLKEATLTVPASGITGASVVASIDPSSIDTKNTDRDAHLKSADFLDVATYDTFSFASTAVTGFDGEDFSLVGDLTLHGQTRSVTLKAEFLGETVDAYGKTRSGFSASGSILRQDYGVTIDMAWGAGNKVVGDKIDIDIDIEFVHAG